MCKGMDGCQEKKNICKNTADEKKLLILSLGVGKKSDQATPQPGGKDNSTGEGKSKEFCCNTAGRTARGYKPARYVINEDGSDSQEANFVGEVLADKYEPDEIIVIGTIKSIWDCFYEKLAMEHSQKEEKTDELFEILDTAKGKDSSKEELDEAQKKINDIFNAAEWGKEGRKVNVHVLLMAYGPITGGESRAHENYKRLEKINEILEGMNAKKIRVAFDITHSFRSMPLYSLTILNYIKALGKYKLLIDHVYYGNLEISSENGWKAPIEDLQYLSTMMELAGAVETFNDTGNVKILIEKCEDICEKAEGVSDGREERFIRKLWEYEFAIQCNDYNRIVDAIKKLMNVEPKTQKQNPIIADVEEMVANVLAQHFGKEIDSTEKSLIQLKLAQMYYQQHQHGLALATGIEGYRSVFVQLYNKEKTEASHRSDLTQQDNKSNDENCRRHAIKKLDLSQDESSILYKICKSINSVKEYRDTFAHCLENFEKDAESKNDYEKIKTDIDDFFKHLNNFVDIKIENGSRREKYENEYKELMHAKKPKSSKSGEEINFFIVSEQPLSKEAEENEKKIIEKDYPKKEIELTDLGEYDEIKNISNNTIRLRKCCELIKNKIENENMEDAIIAIIALNKKTDKDVAERNLSSKESALRPNVNDKKKKTSQNDMKITRAIKYAIELRKLEVKNKIQIFRGGETITLEEGKSEDTVQKE